MKGVAGRTLLPGSSRGDERTEGSDGVEHLQKRVVEERLVRE